MKEIKLSSEIVIFVLAFATIISAFWFAGLIWWAILWAGIGVLLAILEYVSVLKTGKTLSEEFGHLLRERPKIGWGLLLLMVTAFAALIWHLIAMR